MKIIKMSTNRVYGIRLFGRVIKLWTGKDISNTKTFGWVVPPKLKDCPVCWGSGKLFYRIDGIDKGIDKCYFCKGKGKVDINDTRNPYMLNH